MDEVAALLSFRHHVRLINHQSLFHLNGQTKHQVAHVPREHIQEGNTHPLLIILRLIGRQRHAAHRCNDRAARLAHGGLRRATQWREHYAPE